MGRLRGHLAALALALACCSALASALAVAAPQHSRKTAHHAAKGQRLPFALPRLCAVARSAPGRCRHLHHVAARTPAPVSKPAAGQTTGTGSTTVPTSGSAPAPVAEEQPTSSTPPPVVPRVQVTAVEYSFSLSRTTVPAGKVILEFVNKGQDEHNLNALGGEGELAASFANEPSSGVKDETLVLKPGSYTLFCSLPEHEQKGMKATLVVEMSVAATV